MRFDLTEDQRELRDEVREFTKEEIKPKARDLDREEEYPSTIFGELGERRLTGVTLPEEYGAGAKASSNSH